MEVLDKGEKKQLLTNREVYELLCEIQDDKVSQEKQAGQHNLSNIVFTTLAYLKKTPCKDQTAEIVSQFNDAVTAFKLTKAERLQLLNLRPTTDVEIPLIIEDCESRLENEEVNQLIQVITDILPGNKSREQGDDEGQRGDDEDEEEEQDEEMNDE